MPALDDDSRAAILGLLMDPDLTYEEIAAATGWSERTVANVAKAASHKRGKGQHRSPLRDRLHEVAGLSLSEAAAVLGVSRQRVGKLRRDAEQERR